MLELRNVTVRFGDRAVLDDLSLDLEAGTVAAVLGASGSGKTTLLRAIAGLQPLDGGSIAWRNTDLSSVPPHRRNFGLMFQDYALFPHRSVARNVAFGLEMQGAANPSARVAEVLGMVGLEGAGDRSVSTLSGGEQQRVGLARALAPQPEVLMLDEPLGALDRSLRDRLALELRELFTTLDLTVLYVTHDQDEAFAVADDIIVLAGGKVVQHATPEDLWTSPATPYVAEFLGMTMLTGEQAASLG
ncbi:MAG: ABC transporter ATP-binding protein, partial [Acidimicrobiia bacterium]|nr:ABC transporter ATP-binding protein [Acidimicrobiia bacterium]